MQIFDADRRKAHSQISGSRDPGRMPRAAGRVHPDENIFTRRHRTSVKILSAAWRE